MTNIFKKSFCVYDPEADGFRVGSNNGNYAEYVEFKIENGKFYIKDSTSGDGDVFPFSEWEEVNVEQFFEEYEKACIQDYQEQERLENYRELLDNSKAMLEP